MNQILSMTGYGSSSGEIDGQIFTVELRSVNNRFLDISVRLPKNYLFAEDAIKKIISAKVSRGKIDVFVSVKASENANPSVSVNLALAKNYYTALQNIANELQMNEEFKPSVIARFPDVLCVDEKETDQEAVLLGLDKITNEAVDEFNSMRAVEGKRLKTDILNKAEEVSKLVTTVEKLSPETVQKYQNRLTAKLQEILADRQIDEARVITETAIFADKIAVDEETVRLRSHISQLQSMLEAGSPVGRKLDFLVQEFNRESNTIGSKCTDAEISKIVVDLKSEIEKIREQIQNIE